MTHKPTTTIRIAPELKEEANQVFKQLGISMSGAINMFLTNVARTGKMPFELGIVETAGGHPQAKVEGKPPGNAALNRAFRAKKDEFYTQYEDIEKEIEHYPGKFSGKHILCNCDDPFESEFFRYFILNFEKLDLASLTSTCYATSPIATKEYELEHGQKPYLAEVKAVPDEDLILPDGSLNLESVFSMEGNSISWLKGDGDFRSAECVNLLKEADVVVTNPPFSLFREYVAQLMKHEKKFLILGNMNAATYREVFPLFRDNKIWYGQSIRSGDRKFHVPDSYPLTAANCGIDETGRRFIRVKGVRWFTNLDNERRHETLKLTKSFEAGSYPRYENYDAIEVGRTMNIPRDYDGIIGVPITFLDRYNPDQFEIIMLANGNTRSSVPPNTLKEVGYNPHPEDKGGVGILQGKRSYARILLRRAIQ